VEELEKLRRIIASSLEDATSLTLYDVWKKLEGHQEDTNPEEVLHEIAKTFLKVEPKEDVYVFEEVLFKELKGGETKRNKLMATFIRWMIKFLKELSQLHLSFLLLEELSQKECVLSRTIKESGQETKLSKMIYRSFKNFKEQVNKLYESLKEEDYINTYLLYVRAVKTYFNFITLLSALNLKEISEEMKKDPLTGLLNRRYLNIILRDVLELSQYSETPFTVAMLDIDDFKKINDRLGHLVGDCVLREVGRILREFFRKGDYLFRYGGEEFLVLMPSTGREEAKKLLEELRKKVEEHLFLCKEHELKLTVSVGACSDTYKGDKDPTFYLKCADVKLYEAKRSGKNKVLL